MKCNKCKSDCKRYYMVEEKGVNDNWTKKEADKLMQGD